MRTKLTIRYREFGDIEDAQIEHQGYAVCEVERCCDESRKAFRERCRRIKEALEVSGERGTKP